MLLLSITGCGQDAQKAAEETPAPATETPAVEAPATPAGFTISITQIVEHPALNAMQDGFKDKLAELGVQATYNVHIAQGDMAINEQIASQIKGEAPNLVLAITTPSVIAVAQKIQDIPIVFTGVTDPVAAKVVASLEAPGGNVTGMTDMSPVDQQVSLIREFLPEIKTLGVIYNSGETNSVVLVDILKQECAKYGIELREATIDNSAGVTQAAQSLVGKVQAVYVPVDNTVVSALESAVKVCTESKLPLFTADTDSVARGAVAALAIDYYKMGLQTGEIAKRVLDGAAPTTMPVESIKDLSLHVNKPAAEAMGVEIPVAVQDRADKVIY
ncbi:MAG: ABC transporter substrate-binding protein [Proteobacteria bacterium]|nr:ABC transporter substrate-binding protein [Pseudomonadota bacterium]MBU1612744.1 ABC transporter substrate-binding protein [Pseudomonadota bacterium]